MGRQKKKFKPRYYETIGSSNLSATLYASMLQSKPWKRLGNNAKVLYMYMKLQQYGAEPIEGRTDGCFYFNRGMWAETYGLYKNWSQFNRDLCQLVEQGFIEVVENGKTTRTKNIYKFSDKWQRL